VKNKILKQINQVGFAVILVIIIISLIIKFTQLSRWTQ